MMKINRSLTISISWHNTQPFDSVMKASDDAPVDRCNAWFSVKICFELLLDVVQGELTGVIQPGSHGLCLITGDDFRPMPS